MNMEDFNVLTFNTWGLLYISKDIDVRMNAIGNELAKGEYDLIFLQEVWSERHYEIISEKIKNALPYGHYFHSGFLGSGCATFSRYPIVDTLFYKYSHNGYFWDLLHCDWYGGKGVSCAVIKHPKRKIYSFNTHLHAYNPRNFCAGVEECRILQCYQLAQCVNQITRPGDAIVVGADMNYIPNSLGIKAFSALTNLNDTYEISSKKPKDCYTVDPAFNKYLPATEIKSRLDYIFSSNAFECVSCNLTMQKIPSTTLHFSDHEGYRVTLRFKETDEISNQLECTDRTVFRSFLHQLHGVFKKGEKLSGEISILKTLPISIAFILFILMPIFSTNTFHSFFLAVSTWSGRGFFLLQIILVVLCAIYLWVTTYIRLTDAKVFRAVSSEITLKLHALDIIDDMKEE